MAGKAKIGQWVPWTGGRYWLAPDGRRTYYIRRSVGGTRYAVNTGASTERAAIAQLEAFLKDPEGYDPRGAQRPDAIYLDEKLAKDFLDWSEAPQPNGAGNTRKWVHEQKLYLAWWADKLRGVDLRRATLRDHVTPALRRATCRGQRIAVLKKLYAWLREEEHTIAPTEDCTLGVLKIPQARPAQLVRSKAVPRDHVQLCLEHLGSERWRDLLRVLAGTGMHVSELERYAATGTVEPLPRDGRVDGTAGVVVIPSTKAGDPLRVAVTEEVLAAAKRVLAAGTFDRQKLAKAIHSACDAVKLPDGKVGIPRFGPGQLRHAVATWAVNAGADPAAVAAFLGHKSPRTTKRFYATTATPRHVPTLL